MTSDPPGTALVTQPVTLSPEVRRKAEITLRALDETKEDAQKVTALSPDQLRKTAEDYDKAPSSVLAGIVGGVIGSAGGFTLTTFTGAALVVSGPIGLAAGVALGVLSFRGRKYLRLERSSQKTRGALDVLRAELAALPADAPPSAKDAIYEEHARLIRKYGDIATDSLDD